MENSQKTPLEQIMDQIEKILVEKYASKLSYRNHRKYKYILFSFKYLFPWPLLDHKSLDANDDK